MPLTDRERDQLLTALGACHSVNLAGHGHYVPLSGVIDLVVQFAETRPTSIERSDHGYTFRYDAPAKEPR